MACCSEKVAYSNAWMPYAEQIYEVPTHAPDSYVEETKMRHQHAWLLAQLKDEKPTLKARAAYKLIESLKFRSV